MAMQMMLVDYYLISVVLFQISLLSFESSDHLSYCSSGLTTMQFLFLFDIHFFKLIVTQI